MDRTGDVQTAALLASLIDIFVPGPPDPRLAHWILAYDQLLNQLHRWELRAALTIRRNALRRDYTGKEWHLDQSSLPAGKRPPTGENPAGTKDQFKIRPRCGFCGQNLDRASAEEIVANVPAPTEQKLIHNCPKCRNQLPRCAICLEPLALANPYTAAAAAAVSGVGKKSSGGEYRSSERMRIGRVENWFVWCQKCRHGGHSAHVEEWFDTHCECPVAECTCRCNSLFFTK